MSQLDTHQLNGKSNSPKYQNSKFDTQTLNKESTSIKFSDFQLEQSVVLRQSPLWSRAIMVTIMSLAGFGVAWASFAKIEQVIPATGQLKPEGAVQEVQAPVSGVIKDIYIKDGQQVNAGDLLLVFDSTATNAELTSLQKIRTALMQENQIYRQLLQAPISTNSIDLFITSLPREAAFLLRNRTILLAENELLKRELGNAVNQNQLGIDEQQRLQVTQTELNTRTAVGKLEIEQIRRKKNQIQVQIADTKDSLGIEEKIAGKLKILSEQGGISQLQYLQQQKKVQNLKAQLSQLQEEYQRLEFDIEQGQQELKHTVAVTHKNHWEKIANNNKQLAEIESQLAKITLDNEKKLADVNSKISQMQTNLTYQTLQAPVSGTIFDLKAGKGYVSRVSERILSIVPKDSLIAEAFVTNKDIGFVREGMKVDVRIDSFPFSEFGDIKGEVKWVASDALPPDENYRYYRFPIKIKLNRQSLNVQGKDISLQSGMSMTANIKVREERSVISLFTELFTKEIETLKEVR